MTLRRANRQIEVFDVSLMAVVTKAMGAFLVIMLLLLPYYTGAPPSITSPEQARQAVADARQRITDVVQSFGRFSEDPAALRRQLQEAQAALQKADDAIRELKTELDQVWSQYKRQQQDLAEARRQAEQWRAQLAAAEQREAQARTQLAGAAQALAQTREELARTKKELAETRDTLQIAQRVAAVLQAKLKAAPTTLPAGARPIAVLDLVPSRLCGNLGFLPALDFVAAPGAKTDQPAETEVMPVAWQGHAASGGAGPFESLKRQVLRLPGGLGHFFLAVTTDKAPDPAGCDLTGLITVIAAGDAPDGQAAMQTRAMAFEQKIANTGPTLVAVVERSEKALMVRPPTPIDVAVWTTASGGHAPDQAKQSGDDSPPKPAEHSQNSRPARVDRPSSEASQTNAAPP